MVRKIRVVKKTNRATCEHCAYIDEDGDEFYPRAGQWVEYKCKLSGRDYAIVARFGELSESNELSELGEAIPDVIDLIARKVTAWNWTDLLAETDINGRHPKLPEPNYETINNLDFETDLVHLINIVMGDTESEKNA